MIIPKGEKSPNKQKCHGILNITAVCLERTMYPGVTYFLFPVLFLSIANSPHRKAEQASIYHLFSNPKECLKKGKIHLMHSLKIPKLKTLTGWEVIARDLSAPTQQI